MQFKLQDKAWVPLRIALILCSKTRREKLTLAFPAEDDEFALRC